MILTPAQAKAAYDALCALNNVSVTSGAEVHFVGTRAGCEDSPWHLLSIVEDAGGEVTVASGPRGRRREVVTYPSQAAFAAAYGLCSEPAPAPTTAGQA